MFFTNLVIKGQAIMEIICNETKDSKNGNHKGLRELLDSLSITIYVFSAYAVLMVYYTMIMQEKIILFLMSINLTDFANKLQ